MPEPSESDKQVARDLLARIDARRANRQNYEWKITLGLWAGLVAVSKLVSDAAFDLGATELSDRSRWAARIATVLVGAILVVGHLLYHTRFLRPAQRNDVGMARRLEWWLHSAIGAGEVNVGETPAADDPGKWSSAFQVAGSFALAVLAVVLIWLALVG